MWSDPNMAVDRSGDAAARMRTLPVPERATPLSRLAKDELAIRVAGLAKCYTIYARPQDRLKQSLVPRLQRVMRQPEKSYYREFWALHDVSFDVRRGETVGIVGRNGAGKSTLLQILSGVLQASAGTVDIRGRIAALLELGSGFDPEFSGRDNVYLNGALLGLDRGEIDQRFDEIAAFADIGAFIDQPLKMYSSGMQTRLGFAVAACIEPEILIVDEALAVGDVKFQARCFRRLRTLMENGTSILLVSHSVEQIMRHCDRAVLLEAGRVDCIGDPKEVCNRYMDLLFGPRAASCSAVVADGAPGDDRSGGDAAAPGIFEERAGYNDMEYRWGSGEAAIADVLISTGGAPHSPQLVTGTPVDLKIWVEFDRAVATPIFGLTIRTPDGITVFGCNSRDCIDGPVIRAARAGEILCVTFFLDTLPAAGDYLLSLGVVEDRAGQIIPLDRRYDSIHISVSNPVSRSFGLAELKMRVEIQ